MTDRDLNGTLFDSIATAKDAAAALRKERAKANELAAQMQDRSVAMALELRALADELDPPPGPALGVSWADVAAWDKAEPVLTEAQRDAYQRDTRDAAALEWAKVTGLVPSEQTAKHAAPESVEYEPDVKDGRLTLRPTGRSWPAACEMCGAGNGQPCQAVSE